MRSCDNVTFAKSNHSLQKVLSHVLVHLILQEHVENYKWLC